MEKQQTVDDSKVLSATSWAFAAECAAKLVIPVTNMVLARILAPEAFGIVVTVNMVVSFAEMFTGAGFQKYLIQHDFKDDQEVRNSASVAFWANFSIAMAALLFIIIFNEKIAEVVGSPGYGRAIIVASLSLPLTCLSSIYDGLNQRQFNFKLLFIIRMTVCMVPIVITIPLALLGFGFWSLIIGTLAGHVIRDAIYLSSRKVWFPSLHFSFRELKEMLSFGIWTLLEACISWLITWVDVFLISSSLNAYYTGLYKTSQSTVSSTLSIITASIQPVLFSLLSKCQNNAEAFKRSYLNYVSFSAIFLIPAGVGMLVYSDFITSVLLGSQWMEASNFIGLWALCTAIVCLMGELNREAYRAIGKPKISFYVQLSHLVFIVPVCWFAVQKGFHHLALVRPLAYLEVILVHLICMKIYLHIDYGKYFKGLAGPAFASLAMFAFAVFIKRMLPRTFIVTMAEILLCIVFYFGVLCIFRPYREQLMGTIRSVIAKHTARY